MGRIAAPTTGAPTSSAPTAVNRPNHSLVSDKTSETSVDLTIVAAVVITLLGVCIVGSASACFRRRRQRAKARTIDQMKGPAVTNPRFNLSSQHGDGDVYEVPVLATQAYSVFRSVDNVSAVLFSTKRLKVYRNVMKRKVVMQTVTLSPQERNNTC
jgi:hypothetical protein